MSKALMVRDAIVGRSFRGQSPPHADAFHGSECLAVKGFPGQYPDDGFRPTVEPSGWRSGSCHFPVLTKCAGLRAGSIIIRGAIA
jgi:hypothetical protein